MNPKKVLIWIFSIVGSILLLIFFLKVFNIPSREEPNNSANYSNAGISTKPVGKVKTLYRFSDYGDKIIRVDVKSDADFYPKGGKVKVTTSSGNSYISTPGTSEVRPKKPEGIFTFERKDSTAWGMEIWQ